MRKTQIRELAERKMRSDKPELGHEWDDIRRRHLQAAVPDYR
jgi:hypothetical protein